MSLSHGHFLCVQTGQSPREGARGSRLTARSLASGVGQSSARNEPGEGCSKVQNKWGDLAYSMI